MQNIVTLNKHAYFATDTFSDKNGGADSEKLVPNHQDLFMNSDTNALALAKDHSKSNKKKEIENYKEEEGIDGEMHHNRLPKSCK